MVSSRGYHLWFLLVVLACGSCSRLWFPTTGDVADAGVGDGSGGGSGGCACPRPNSDDADDFADGDADVENALG